MKRILLGSQSPRRKEILNAFSIPFEQVSPNFDEDSIAFYGEPGVFACMLAKGKADSLSHLYPDSLIITADTIVYLDGKSYVKPRDEEDAKAMITALSGKIHSVFTGVAVREGNKILSKSEETRVHFNTLSPLYIEKYVSSQNWRDKAGGYGTTEAGGLLIKKFEGCVYNVTGLPINTLYELLQQFDIDLWNFLKERK